MIEKDYEYYKAHRAELLREHAGEFVVIENESPLGFYPDQSTALDAMKDHELGNFLVKKVVPAEEDVVAIHTPSFFFA